MADGQQVRLPLNLTGPGDQVLVAADPINGVCLLTLVAVVSADCALTFKSGATPLTGPIPMRAYGSITLDALREEADQAADDPCWLIAAGGQALVVEISTGATLAGFIRIRAI